MIREIKIQVNTQPTDYSASFAFHIVDTGNSYSEDWGATFADIGGAGLVQIGVDLAETIDNLYAVIVARFSIHSFMSFSQNSDSVSILIDSPMVTSSTFVLFGDLTITHEDTPTEDEEFTNENIILSRSPYFIPVTPAVPFDKAVMNLKIYRGDIDIDLPALPNYTQSNQVIIAGQSTIYFEIHKLVNDFTKRPYTAVANSTGSFTTSSFDSVWVDAEIIPSYLGTNLPTITKRFLAVDGFGYHIEMSNPQLTKKVLSSISEHIIYDGADYPLYFQTAGLVAITVNGIDVPFTFSQTQNNQIIGYVNISQYIGVSETFTAVFEYDTETVTHYFEIKQECRFNVVNCIFKNKYGVWQTIPFNRLSKKSIDFESSDYQGLISSFGAYNLNAHAKKTFLPMGKEKITVNTDFIPENYNRLFVELGLSEFVYLQETGDVLPVNILKKSFDKKTKLNNKLIQYSMDFEYSFNIMNTVI